MNSLCHTASCHTSAICFTQGNIDVSKLPSQFVHPLLPSLCPQVHSPLVKSLSRVRLLATPWTIAYQASPSIGFSRQGYWSGLPLPSPRYLPDPGSNPGLPHCKQTLYPLSHQGSLSNLATNQNSHSPLFELNHLLEHLIKLKEIFTCVYTILYNKGYD